MPIPASASPTAAPASRRGLAVLLAALLTAGALSGCTGGIQEGVLRLGYFPNLTHAQALLGISTGLYAQALGDTRLATTAFNAGPAAFEALLSGQIDVIYVGPGPTISALERTGLDVIVIVAGGASGGAMFVVQKDLAFRDNASYANRRFATPGLANTQDVALKHFLLERGLRTRDRGGSVDVINAQNADILSLFEQRHIDGAWVPEPWATRLVREGGGTVHVNESDLWPGGTFVTTHIVTTRKFLQQREQDVRNLVEAHGNATRRLQAGGPDVLEAINDGIEGVTGKRIEDTTLKAAFPNIRFTDDPLQDTLRRQYEMSHALGFSEAPPGALDRAYDLRLLPQAQAGNASG